MTKSDSEVSAVIYLDNAATSWPKPETVYQAVDDCLRRLGGSPGRGGYATAREGDRLLFETREELAALFGADNSGNIMFAHNATDALNTALFGLLRPGDRVITTSLEHNAVARPLRILEKQGIILEIIDCGRAGRLDPEDLAAALRGGARAIVAGHGSNVTGALAPLAELGRLAAAAGALLIVDAAQTAGIEAIDVKAMGIDVLAFSGHKGLLGPQGTGGLYVRDTLTVNPLRYGGTGSQSELDVQPEYYPDRLESGTPNTPGIAGLLAGVRFIRQTGSAAIKKKEQQLCQELMAGLADIGPVTIHGPAANEERTATVSFTVAAMDSGEVAFRMDRDFGIACRSGLHCAPWAHRTVGTLGTGTVRLSPGYFNSSADIAAALDAIELITRRRGNR